jgi:peptidoglycan/xylan/chitin deacetylase (PgdA/CDA1 family)
LLFQNPSYWCFDYWKELENAHNRKSIFYIYVKNGKNSFKSWLINPSYDIYRNIKLQNKLKELYKEGFEIGLHGSYESAKDFQKLKEEKEILEKVLGIKIIKTRQHWLNYFENITPKIHEEFFEYDSTLGWNDRIGFRSGSASLYNPYNFDEQKAFKYQIIPQVIMDSNVYDYANNENIFLKAKEIIQKAKDVSKTTNISISWHQRVSSNDYNWHKFYEEILIAF